MSAKNTLVIGASENPERYSYLAVNKLKNYGHPVKAIGRRQGQVNGIEIMTGTPDLKEIDTISLYLNPTNQQAYYDYILNLHPKRIIFNPGAENPELEALAEEKGIKTMEACTLVLLSTNQF